jgi:hypothetical protein
MSIGAWIKWLSANLSGEYLNRIQLSYQSIAQSQHKNEQRIATVPTQVRV